MNKVALIIVSLILALVAGLVGCTAQPVTVTTLAPDATISPTAGVIDTEVMVSASGFIADSTITISYDGDSVVTDPLTIIAMADGSFNASFYIPASESGNHKITISDGTNSVTANFVVVAEAVISPTSGSVGDEVTVSGTGFGASRTITITYNNSVVTLMIPIITGPDGSFSGSFTIPASAGGSHTITINDGVTTKQFAFVMESMPPAPPQPQLPYGNSKPEQPVRFDWADVTDSSLPLTYSLQIATDTGYTNIVLQKGRLFISEYTMTEAEELEPNKTYWWRVRAIDGAYNTSNWSPSGSFYIESGTTQPPEYHVLSFTIAVDEQYSFPIYVRNEETLHLFVRVESPLDGTLRLDILTPSGMTVHSYGIWSPGEYANGTLCDYASQPFSEYTTAFSPSDYDWGQGYYRMTIRHDFPDVPVTGRVDYWIE